MYLVGFITFYTENEKIFCVFFLKMSSRVFSRVAATPVSLDFQLGENVFPSKLALTQQFFPSSILWAHPMHSDF